MNKSVSFLGAKANICWQNAQIQGAAWYDFVTQIKAAGSATLKCKMKVKFRWHRLVTLRKLWSTS